LTKKTQSGFRKAHAGVDGDSKARNSGGTSPGVVIQKANRTFSNILDSGAAEESDSQTDADKKQSQKAEIRCPKDIGNGAPQTKSGKKRREAQ